MIYFDGLPPMDYFTLRVDDFIDPREERIRLGDPLGGGSSSGPAFGNGGGSRTGTGRRLDERLRDRRPRLDERPRPISPILENDILIPPKPDPVQKVSGHYDIRLSIINQAGFGELLVNGVKDDKLTLNIANGNVINTRELVGKKLELQYGLGDAKSYTKYVIETKTESQDIFGSFGKKILKGPAIYTTKYSYGNAPVRTREVDPTFLEQFNTLGKSKVITLSFDTSNLFTPPPPPPPPPPVDVDTEDEVDDIYIPPTIAAGQFTYQLDVDFNGDDEKTEGLFKYSFGDKSGTLEERVYSIVKDVNGLLDEVTNFSGVIPFNINLLNGQVGLETLSKYDVFFLLYKNGQLINTSPNFNQTYNLSPNTSYLLKVELRRKQVTSETPRLTVGDTQYSIDKKSTDALLVRYRANGVTDKVLVSFGNTKRELLPKSGKDNKTQIVASKVGFEGSVSFTANDFDRIGRHKIVLTPTKTVRTPQRLSGDVVYPPRDIVVNGESVVFYIDVTDTKITVGPDITHITYPENIKGADFKGYDVEFRINWASINANYVEVFAGKESPQHRLIDKGDPQGVATFNVREVLTRAGQNIDESQKSVNFKLLLRPTGQKNLKGKLEEINIKFDKGDLELKRGVVVRDIKEAIKRTFETKVLTQENSKYLTHLLHLGEGDNRIISTWGIDKQTFDDPSIVLKLYEPLPKTVQPNQQVWISKIQSIPIIEQVTLIDEEVKECIPLQPNFNTQFVDDVGLQIYDDLVASGSATSTDIINQFVSGSGFNLKDLDIQFVSSSTALIEFDNGGKIIEETVGTDYYWANFVKYSSAEERVENYVYKLGLIDFYSTRIELVTSGSHYTSSISLQNEKTKLERQINDVKAGFDAFEDYLYKNEISSSNQSYSGLLSSAQNYDETNSSRLTYNLPEHILNDKNNSEYVLFFDMIGQHFDNLWVYTKAIARKNRLEHKHKEGVIDKFIYQMLESMGWDADIGVSSQALWDYAYGKDSDGTSYSTQSGKDRQNEIWRRILNNLPYLLKHKGTRRSMHALMACYGIPASLLTIIEFGGPREITESGTTKFTYEDRTASINISGSAAITIPWKTYTSGSETDYPNTFEIRLNTEQKQNQQIVSGSDWSLDILKDTGSLGKVQLTVGSDLVTSSTLPLFDDEYYHIAVTRESGSDFTLYVKQGFQERIRNEVSATLTAASASWESGSELKIGGSTFTGSIDEIRLWRTALNEAVIENHTLVPDAINGNHNSASSEDLIFRNDFEYPKDRNSDVDIKNVALIQTYVTSSVASGFESITSYPYQYTPYDRTVTAQVPQTGFNYSNKVRLESQYKQNSTTTLSATSSIDLSYRQRSTKRSFDQSPIDSNRLGLFFSPVKEINMDILRSVGPINVDDFIGNPADDYNSTYQDLDNFRQYYFQRYNLNFNEYIQLVRQIEKTMFDQLADLAPARSKVSSGLLIEPHILERSKTQWNKPSGDENYHETVIDTTDITDINVENPQYLMYVSASEDTKLSTEKSFYDTTISDIENTSLVGELNNYVGTYQNQEDTTLIGTLTRNSGSTMGGFEIFIDAQITGSLLDSYYQSSGYQQVGGFGKDSLAEGGFGLYGENSYSIRTRIDGAGNHVKDKVRVFRIKEEIQEIEPQNTNFNDSSIGTTDVVVTRYRQKVLVLSTSGSAPTTGNGIVEVEPLNGYFSTHYRYVEDLPTGLENSYFNGSKQTALTTLDGGSPVEVFTTNPNTLRVSDSGRGSGEPILEVD